MIRFFKKKVIKQIDHYAWSHLVTVHNIHVRAVYDEMRCVERKGILEDRTRVTFLRVFNLDEAAQKGILIRGWETFDEHPDLIIFEGYLTESNKAHLKPKNETRHGKGGG